MKNIKRIGLAALFIGIAFLPALSAVFVKTDGWYAMVLDKPSWNPPSWIFGPVWTALYFMIGLAGYLAWTNGGHEGRRRAFTAYGLQLLANGLWSWLFFGLHRIGWAMADLVLLWFLILRCAGLFRRRSLLSARLLMPYFYWVSFAGILNAAIMLLN